MNPDRWKRTEAVLGAVLDAPPDARLAVLLAECGDDADLLAEVRSLLAAHDADVRWQPPTAPADVQAGAPREAPGADRRIGAYRVERLIGRGGMGAVYLAHRAEGDFDQKVAVKVVGLPFEIEAFRERFRQERQILAELNHPNITHLTDGGVTADGELYLVMELIEGLPLDEYARRHALGVAARLQQLFLPICDAVAYAHQRLVIHRDLKPSNIMVTDAGIPKLLDFGTAKVLSADDSLADHTQTSLGLVTASYASPEQLRSEPVSTLTDVYSLSVILYELIAGARLFATNDVLSRLDGTRALTFPVAVPGDLDRIVRKGLADSLVDRYASVEQLAADVRRFLAGRPVLAHPRSPLYRARKFVRRHVWSVSASLLAAAMLAGALVFSFAQARAARAQRDRAERINAFLIDMLGSPNPSWYNTLKTKGKNVTVLDVLDELGGRLGSELAGQPDVEIELRRTIGRMYSTIGQHDHARLHLDRALVLQRSQPPDALTLAKLQVAVAQENVYGAKLTEAIDLARAAIALLEPRQRAEDRKTLMEAYNAQGVALTGSGALPSTIEPIIQRSIDLSRAEYGLTTPTAVTIGTLAALKSAQGHFDASVALAKDALKVFEALPNGLPPEASSTIRELAEVELERGDFAAAERHLDQALALLDKGFGLENVYAPVPRALHAVAVASSGRLAEATREAADALALSIRLTGPDSATTINVQANLGRVMLLAGDYRAAEASLRQALERGRQRFDSRDLRLTMMEVRLGQALLAQGRSADAALLLTKAVHTLTASVGADHVWTRTAQVALDRVARAAGGDPQ